VGLYGVMTYTVARRTREIGIRMALGAHRAGVLWLVLREVSWLAGIGVVLGVAAAVAVTRTLESQLFGLSPTDPLTLAASTVVLAAVALGSGLLPAHRASTVDPLLALRHE
jgi:ABC-type antimicrobial peptide transport system permease subunit